LIQSVAIISPKRIINSVKSITAKEIFRLHPDVKRKLWRGKFWSSGYYVNTVGQYANEEVIKKYLQNQGKSNYEKVHTNQLRLF
jgi:putative transposase